MEIIDLHIPEEQQNDGLTFPLVLGTNSSNHSWQEWRKYLEDHRDQILKRLDQHGAILFRGFGMENAQDFMDFLNAMKFEFGSYLGGGGPRKVILGPIHTSTESPAHFVIPYHHELAYLTKYPTKLVFFGEIPAQDEGETPILNSNRLYKKILERVPEFIRNVTEKKVRYTRVIADKVNCTGEYQRSWQEAFDTDDKKVAEDRARQVGTEIIEWLEDGSMKVVSAPLDAVRIDPRNNKETWFNSVVLLHPSTPGNSPNSPWRPTYGDFSEINPDHIRTVHQIMQDEGIKWKWVKGDVLLVDNFLSLHARNKFTPPRRILAAIANN